METINELLDTWEMIKEKYGDPRTKGWFMVDEVYPGLLISLCYFIMVLVAPSVMKNREPFEIRKILIVYNLAMVLLSSYIFYEFLAAGWWFDYSLGCQPVDYSLRPKAIRMTKVSWVFYMSKFVELLDTVFFIMRKKFNQVSFLHVFHHGIMAPSWWIGVKFTPGGFGTFHGMLNSFIHIVMYTYYGMSAFGDRFQKYLWWKKYMTQMQIIQFVTVIIHTAQLFFIKCNYPMLFVYIIMSYAFIFLVFFSNFFVHEYILKRNKAKETQKLLKSGKDKTN